jgi:L-fuculose-phosphate aldolase
VSEEACLRAEIVRIAQAMDRAGFAPTKSGNVSARWDDALLITPSSLPYAVMTPDDLVVLDLNGDLRGGGRRPSSEWRLHASIYRVRPDAQAIVHTHSPRATALACARRGIPAIHYMVALCGGADVRCAEYATFGTQALADNAIAALDGRKAALLANHGVITLGTTLEGAYVIAGEVENLAGQYVDLLAAGLQPCVLDGSEMSAVAERFGEYGKFG